ncbi:G-protein coupled receptor GRL101-like [Littorina saxatilis]|uniref:G-protein coupled receptor GRL101-like n=1 Tax=Littorina saxatilis TaxID=31220 RepID=UPI0038B5C5DA
MNFHNLQSLDLSGNRIKAVDMNVFQNLENLLELILSNNPISQLSCVGCTFDHMFLLRVDMSMSQLSHFDTGPLANFSNIRHLNLSSSPISTIGEAGFSQIPHLEVLDIRHIPLTTFPKTMLKGLPGLRTIYAENYKLCCKATLPEYFDLNKCFAPTDEISSCEELLRSDVYRFFLWIFASMSILGNVGSFVYRLCSKEHVSKIGFDVLVTNLSVSDFLMGVYLAIIGAADRLYHGNYIWHDKAWKESVVCQIAGCLSLMSSEVSAFIICLITLDRLLVFRYPFSAVRFRRRSAKVACGIAWFIGFALAAIPLLPMTSHWRFYGQTGICIPLPITRNIVNGRKYSFAVMSVLNLVLFVLIALGQVFIFLSVKFNSIATDPTRQSRDIAIARTLATIVLTDFLCWFPIGLLGLLASVGVPIPDEVNVGIAIFVLPLNSALNPFLYTFNTQMERRRRATETEMIRALEKRILAELYAADDNACAARNRSALTQKEAKDRIKTLVKVHSSCSLSSTDAFSAFGRKLPRTRGSNRGAACSVDDSALPLSKQEAISLIQEMLERKVVTQEEISPLIQRKPVREISENAIVTFRNIGSGSEDDDVFENLHAVSFS